jgi:hypothetical protein
MLSFCDGLFFYGLLSYIAFGALYNLWRFVAFGEPHCKEVEYPEVVHGFHVTSEAGKSRVLEFFEWLHAEEDKEQVVSESSKDGGRLNLHDMVQLTPSQVENLLKYLYNQPRMWERLASEKQSNVVEEWVNTLNNAAVAFFAIQTEAMYTETSKDGQTRVAIAYFHNLIRFSKVYTNPQFGMGKSKFLANILRACVDLCVQDGMLPALLLLAHLRPDLVTDDVYPVLNNETAYYKDLIAPTDLEVYPVYKELLTKYNDFVIL